MRLHFKKCHCTFTMTNDEWNDLITYIRKLENAIGRTCANCIGCEVPKDIHVNPCDSWIWRGKVE